jgi:hypothetical protein
MMNSCQVYSMKVTHTSCHAGVVEAYNLSLGLKDICHLGRWLMGQMEAFYMPQNPVNGAFTMSNFPQHKPYFLLCDLEAPPLSLQWMIFKEIKQTFEKDQPHLTTDWIKECNAAMEGVDPNTPTTEDLHWKPPPKKNQEQQTEQMMFKSALVE